MLNTKYEEQKSTLSDIEEINRKLEFKISEKNFNDRSNLIHRNNYESITFQIFSSIFPRLKFPLDSYKTIFNEFKKLEPLLSVLKKLNDKDGTLDSTSINAHHPWKEVTNHIATGDKNAGSMGRVYYANGGDDRLIVVVHKKKNGTEQGRLFDNLSSILDQGINDFHERAI